MTMPPRQGASTDPFKLQAPATVGPPAFPIDIVFVSSLIGGTDWNPQITSITYPPPVGGTIRPLDLTFLSATVLVLALLGTTTLIYKRRHP